MKIIKQIFIILLFYIIGELVAYFIQKLVNIYIPGTIIGMSILLLFLITKKIKLKHVDDVGTFLTNNMAFFFIPAAVSVIEYYEILKYTFFKIIMIIIMSAIISFILIAYVVKLTINLQNKLINRRGK